MNIRIIAY